MNSDQYIKKNECDEDVLLFTESPMVVFSVATGGGNTAIGPFKRDKTLIYRKVITNDGNAYSPSTGKYSRNFLNLFFFI